VNISKLLTRRGPLLGSMLLNMESQQLSVFFKGDKRFSTLKEPTVHGWKNLYLREVDIQSQNRKRTDSPVQIKELPSKRQGRPLLLGEKWEDEVKSFVKVQ